MKKKSTVNVILTLVILVIFLRTCVSNTFPIILPYLKTYFNTDRQLTELSISLFFAGLGVSQLIYGPLSDKYGRKKILITGEVIFFISCIGCIFSYTITEFIILCLIQGIGLGCTFSLTSAIMRDIYSDKEKLSKKLSLLEGSYGLALIIAPLLSGYIEEMFNWITVFIIISIFTAILIILLLFLLIETNQHYLTNSLKDIVSNYKLMSKNIYFISLLIVLTLSAVFTLFFNQVSPFLAQIYFQLSPVRFGVLMMLIGLFYILGVITNIVLSNFIGIYKKTLYALILCCFIYFAMLVALYLNYINIYILFVPRYLLIFAWGLIFPNVKAMAMLCYSKKLGGACSAYIGFFIYFFSSLVTSFFAELDIKTLINFSYLNLLLSMIGLISYIYYIKTKKQNNGIRI